MPSGATIESLTTTASPEPKLVFTNCVYISATQSHILRYDNKPNYVLINNAIVYMIQIDPRITDGCIGINSLQRESLHITANEVVTVQQYKPNKQEQIGLLVCKINLELISKKRVSLKEVDIIKQLQQQYTYQIFSKNQVFAVECDTVALRITVTALEQASAGDENGNTDDLSHYVTRGMILSSTDFDITVSEDKNLKYEKSAANKRSKLLNPDWKFEDMGIGGLDKEFSSLFRRAFASRLFPPEIIAQLGIKHVKGMILYGPPGTGKTLIARQIGKMLAGKEPKVVNGPEILNKFVGASEENIRKLFADAEVDYATNKENSDLHIIIFDEIDAICKARGSTGGGTGVQDTVVNQLLTKIDGVDSPNNILVIGMTNRKDMLDPALLRPGRLEVHVEISLPDEQGRQQILKIHTNKMRENGKLANNVDLLALAQQTKNFSGAELEGLVKSATSYALYGCVDFAKGNVALKPKDLTNIIVTQDDFNAALDEVIPAFGVAENELKTLIRGDLINYGDRFAKLLSNIRTQIRMVANAENHTTQLHSVLLHGISGTGKTAIAASLALESDFPYVKLISPDQFIGLSEQAKIIEINKIFEDAYKSPLSLILIDDIERLVEYVHIGPRFSNTVLQTLQVLIKRIPPKDNKKLLIFSTTTDISVLEDMQITNTFNVKYQVPLLDKPTEIQRVFELMQVDVEPTDLQQILQTCELPIAIKQLQLIIEMAKQDKTGVSDRTVPVTADRFVECLLDVGLTPRITQNGEQLLRQPIKR